MERWLAGQRGLVKGIGDDCATFAPGGPRVLLTDDAFVERVHFRRAWMPARDAGWKALAANVSDIAAAGGTPQAALVSLELPPRLPVAWVRDLYRGLLACARRYGVAIAGGNISAGPHVAVHIALAGRAPRKLVGRGGARPGDLLVVTGALGGSLAGLLALKRGLAGPAARAAIRRHFHPEPRVEAGRILARYASAMVDISDGLAHEAGLIARASGVRAMIDPAKVPVHPAARALAPRLGKSPASLALGSGEEYELLAAIPRRAFGAVRSALIAIGGTLLQAGSLARGRGLSVGGRASWGTGFDHFQE